MKLPSYYEKKICRMKDLQTGDWVYNEDAELCYVEIVPREDCEYGPRYTLHAYMIEILVSEDTIVYPLSLQTKALADRMAEHRRKYHDANIMNADFSRELDQEFHKIMLVDESDRIESCKQYKEIWDRLDARLEELIGYAEKLHIKPKR